MGRDVHVAKKTVSPIINKPSSGLWTSAVMHLSAFFQLVKSYMYSYIHVLIRVATVHVCPWIELVCTPEVEVSPISPVKLKNIHFCKTQISKFPTWKCHLQTKEIFAALIIDVSFNHISWLILANLFLDFRTPIYSCRHNIHGPKISLLPVFCFEGLQDISCISNCMGLLHLELANNHLSNLKDLGKSTHTWLVYELYFTCRYSCLVALV